MTPTQLKPSEAKEGQNLNTYLQGLTSKGDNFNDTTNWLVFNDNEIEKLVAKKPIKYNISWDDLYNTEVVFRKKTDTPDIINYIPTYVTINNKKYVVRLLRAYNEKIGINDSRNWDQYDDRHYNATKGSEWNRLILPLIEDKQDSNYIEGGRRSSDNASKKFVESNMSTLANYSWWTDFGARQRGYWRWMQETSFDDSEWRATRGVDTSGIVAGNVFKNNSNVNNEMSWQPVLEKIDN